MAIRDVFESRKDLADAGVHKPLVAGISGSQMEGADSIVMSGGYEDDQDHGDEVVYTGHGGNDADSERQVEHQEWTRGNQSLRLNQSQGLPVRLVRGSRLNSPHAPPSGFRYDGLYRVDDSWMETGVSGNQICRFRLVSSDSIFERESEPSPTRRAQSILQRVVRNNAIALEVKRLHDFTCQVCSQRLVTPGGEYAEGAHIRGIGSPHDGPDSIGNLLCPNCHVLFDQGSFVITDVLEVQSVIDCERNGRVLRTVPDHQIDAAQLVYHRGIHSKQ